MNIDELCKDFDQYAEESKTQLSLMLSTITEGKVPTRESVSQLDLSIANLRVKYESVVQAATDQLADYELPNKNASVSEYVEAIMNSKSIRIRQQIESTKNCLQKFLSVRSLVSAYTEALSPIQKQAYEILHSLDYPETVEIEVLEESTVGPRTLLAAIEFEDKDSDEGIALCDQVAAYYPGRIYSGVVANKYYVDNSANNDTDIISQTQTDSGNDHITGRLAEQSEYSDFDDEKNSNSEDGSSENSMTDTIPDDIVKSADTEPSAFVKALNSMGCIYESGDCFGTMSVEKSASESKKISATVFRNEMKKGVVPAEKEILRAVNTRNVVTIDYLTAVRGVPENYAEVSLAYMFKSGYLRKYILAPGGEFFCASHRLQLALSFLDASKFAGVKQRKVSEWGENIEDEASSVASRLSFSRVYDDCVNRLTSRNVERYTETSRILTNAFCGRIFDAENIADCYVIAGAFWDATDECDLFHDALEEIISDCEGITSFVFSSYDVRCAKKTVDVISSSYDGKIKNVPIYLYVLSEDKYYSYPELDPISKDDMQMPNNENGTPNETSGKNAVNETPSNAKSFGSGSGDTEGNPESNMTDAGNDVSSQNDISESRVQEARDTHEMLESSDLETGVGSNRTGGKDRRDVELSGNVPPKSSEEHVEDMIHRLVDSSSVPSDDELYEVIVSILNGNAGNTYSEDSYVAQALLLAKAASFSTNNTKCYSLYRQLTLAAKSPLDEIAYTSENLSSVLNADSPEAIILAAYLFGLLVPGAAYDYSLRSQGEEYLRAFGDYFPSLLSVKPLFAKLNTVRSIVPAGFSESVLVRLGSAAEKEKYLNELQKQAKSLLSVSVPKTKGKMIKSLPALYSTFFDKESDLYNCLEIVIGNRADDVDFVKTVLLDYCDEREDTFSINDGKVEQKLDEMCQLVRDDFQLGYDKRKQVLRQITNRLNVIKAWEAHVSVSSAGKYDVERLRTLRDEIVELSDKARADISVATVEYKAVIVWALKAISGYLTAPLSATAGLFTELAYTGVISLDGEMLPVLLEDLNSVKYYEPWRTVLRHILSPIKNFEEAKNEILDGGEKSDLFDNLHQLEVIGNLIGEQLVSSDAQVNAARETALGNSKDFDDALELAYTYNRISETEKENLAGIKRQHEAAFLEREDYGIWRQFLGALKKRIDELTSIRKTELQRMLNARYAKENGIDSPILKEAQVLLDRDLNFAVTEEYINRFDNGEEDFSEELQSVLHETDHFAEFISDEVFIPIYSECYKRRENNFHSFAREYLSRNFPAEWTARLKEDSIRFVGKETKNEKYWPIRKDTATPSQMTSLFNWLGMNVSGAEKISSKSEEMFRLKVISSPRSMADYRHPISLFGTQAKSQMHAIVLHGNIPAKQLVDKISGLGLGGMSVVILNYPINLAVRRQIAEEFHKTTGQNPFILIDQTLVIYLALHQITERLPILLKCSLPYTTYQPFVRDGGSTADEMFFGRSKELATIKDPNGACVVYGGRQLGKTALLERAESLCFKPENRAYAVYCNILNCTTEECMVMKIVEDVQKKTGFKLQNCKTIKNLCNEFEKLFQSGKMESMLLLIDETDKFLEAIADQNYAQLQPMIDLKRSTKNRFKFVLAGLHNVCRAKNATARNGVFGQLGTPLCVKPLSPTDALQLLSRPLRYLGFQIDRYPHLETILTNTNYYPGILQFFGYMLVETLSTHYGKYYRAVDGNPPYTLQDDQLGAVMNSADLNRSIRDKFRWSLELDPRYYMIARCIAVLYYLSDESANTWLGFSVEEIIDIATSYKIHCLKEAGESEYLNLLDEMVEMGILSKPDAEKKLYRLRRSSFINIIGADFDTVDADIQKNNLEVE